MVSGDAGTSNGSSSTDKTDQKKKYEMKMARRDCIAVVNIIYLGWIGIRKRGGGSRARASGDGGEETVRKSMASTPDY